MTYVFFPTEKPDAIRYPECIIVEYQCDLGQAHYLWSATLEAARDPEYMHVEYQTPWYSMGAEYKTPEENISMGIRRVEVPGDDGYDPEFGYLKGITTASLVLCVVFVVFSAALWTMRCICYRHGAETRGLRETLIGLTFAV
jgi:hypothetical protein